MPTYEFRCPNGHDFEKFYRKISDAPSQVPCPECGVVAERRMSAGAGLLFKGSGFYITDYGKDGKGVRKDSGADAKGGDAKADTKAGEKAPGGESKPASKPASKPESSPVQKSESKKSSGGTGSGSGGSSGGSAGGAA